MSSELEARFEQLVEHHVRHGVMPPAEEVAADRPDLVASLKALAERYLALSTTLDAGAGSPPADSMAFDAEALPAIPGFRTIERLGAGGMGEVYKLRDLTLDRFVAAKVIRADRQIHAHLADFLGEAKSMALFKDRRIVQIFEFRSTADPPVIIMEFVEGFELGKVGPSLEFTQRARILREVCDAIHHAHQLGLQHRDLKPSNIMLDASLAPKILDFGLSGSDPSRGHLRGTPAYIAPEQLDPSQAIDARSDVYAMGVILYQLLCGALPFAGDDTATLIAAIRSAAPRLPIEIDARVPEPLQAIALKAMERRPADRYASAQEMAQDLTRYLERRPVLAKPTQYATTLDARVRPHLGQLDEWQRLKLIYPHEADHLRAAYKRLEARDDDWIASSRALSYSQIALYFGAFLLLAGAMFYFSADRAGHVSGIFAPAVVLALPFAGLNAAGWHLYRTERRAVAVAFFLAGVALLPLFLLIWFHESQVLAPAKNATNQLFDDGSISNRQLQITLGVACAWAGWLATRTRTAALSTVFAALGCLLAIAILGDFGLRDWVQNRDYHLVALHLWPLAIAYLAVGAAFERTGRTWFVQPLYVAAALVVVSVLDLLALNGKAFHYLGVSLQHLPIFQSSKPDVDTRLLVDTLAALSVNGMAFYALGAVINRRGGQLAVTATLFFTIAPFSMLEPLADLVSTGSYSLRFDWTYAALAMAIAIVSHHRQRKSFYYAGVLNVGVALYFAAQHRGWLDNAGWATTLVVLGLVALILGFRLDADEHRRNG